MVQLRIEFSKQFQAKGFGFVEGPKWTTYENQESYRQMDSYKTKAQILKAEAKDEEATEAKIKWAMSLGQGTVDDPKGWHYNPTRIVSRCTCTWRTWGTTGR